MDGEEDENGRERRLAGGACIPAALPAGVLPPYPGPAIVPMVQVPPPPLLDPSLGATGRARVLANAYCAVAKERYGVAYWAFARCKNIARQRNYTLLCKAADAMCAARIAPIAWCLSSWAQWRHINPAEPFPRIPWIMRVDRIEKRAGQFDNARYAGGRVVVGRKHRELIERWLAARTALQKLANAQVSDARMAKCVRRHWPEGLWETMVEDAVAQAQAKQKQLDADAARGVWLW